MCIGGENKVEQEDGKTEVMDKERNDDMLKKGTYSKSKIYKGVYSGGINRSKSKIWFSSLTYKGTKWKSKYFDEERDAALAYDKKIN